MLIRRVSSTRAVKVLRVGWENGEGHNIIGKVGVKRAVRETLREAKLDKSYCFFLFSEILKIQDEIYYSQHLWGVTVQKRKGVKE